MFVHSEFHRRSFLPYSILAAPLLGARLRAAGLAFPLVDDVYLIPPEARWVD